ncbi:MAG: hypothetical protein D6B25_14390 [Desulfobulbaceae bacterium]|nr:MAG: hypothetical protein D6B25_14390 [Desulfobulbaceae bacterium]
MILRGSLFIFIVLPLLAGCVTYKRIGGYEIYGLVIDSISLKPVAGVDVSARYEAVSMYGNHSEILVSGVTGDDGRFKMSVPKTTKWGGTGGLSGYVSEWPSLHYTKEGYCKMSVSFKDPTIKKYQDIELKLRSKDGTNCL